MDTFLSEYASKPIYCLSIKHSPSIAKAQWRNAIGLDLSIKIQHYKNAGGDLIVIPELEAFLDCALTYLAHFCRPEEFNFISLEKFARATKRGTHTSPFEIILRDAPKSMMKDKLNRYCELYGLWTPKQLANATKIIMSYLQEKHGNCQVHFRLKHMNPLRMRNPK